MLAPEATCVAELDGVMVGFATVLPRPDGDAELDGLFVEPHLWRSGVGRALVSRANELARDCGARFLNVVANPCYAFDSTRTACRLFVDYGTTETQYRLGRLDA